MSTSTQRQQIQDAMYGRPMDGRSGLARKLTQPAPSPGPSEAEKREIRRLERKLQRKAAHRAVMQHVAGIAIVGGIVGAVFLGGHVQLAREAQRSVVVTEMLNQQLERSRSLRNRQATDVTPTTINQKAGGQGMVRPDERETIVME